MDGEDGIVVTGERQEREELSGTEKTEVWKSGNDQGDKLYGKDQRNTEE